MLNKIQRVLLTGSGLWYLGAGMLGPLFAVFAQRVGGDVLQITWAWAAYLLVMGVLTIVIGKFSDKLKKERIMLIGYGLNAVFTFCYLFVGEPVSLMLVQAGMGVAAALATPTWDAIYSHHDDKRRDGEAWGIADGMPLVVGGIAALIGGIIITEYSFAVLFVIMGVIQVIAAVYQARILYLPRTRVSAAKNA